MKNEKSNDNNQNNISDFSKWFDKEMNTVNESQFSEAAKALFKMYRSFLEAGFSETQAFALIVHMLSLH